MYARLEPSVQDALKCRIVPVIKTLGPNNPKLLDLLRTFPPEAEYAVPSLQKLIRYRARLKWLAGLTF